VDIAGELAAFDWGINARYYPGKIHARCPFRDESTPSFVVFLYKGNWVDRGFARPGYEKGDFLTLLAFLKGTDRENTKRYLIRKYLAVDPEGLTLDLKLTLEPPAYPVLDMAMLDNLQPCEYLAGRGIDYGIQARYRVGYPRPQAGGGTPVVRYRRAAGERQIPVRRGKGLPMRRRRAGIEQSPFRVCGNFTRGHPVYHRSGD